MACGLNSCGPPQPCPMPQPVIPRGLPPPACFQPPQSCCQPPPPQPCCLPPPPPPQPCCLPPPPPPQPCCLPPPPPPQQCCQPVQCCPPVDNCCDRTDRIVNPMDLSPLPPGLRDMNPCNPVACPQPYRVPGGENCPPWVRWGGPVGFNPGWGGSLWPGNSNSRN